MRLAHRIDGPEGAPVLVLPCSLGTSRELWEPQLATFARSFRVLRYEHRGHGDSPVLPGPYTIEELARDALGLLDELALERVSWCGLSLGGMVGLWLGAHAPERLASLVLACTSARVPAPELYRERAATVRAQGLAPVADTVVSRWFTASVSPALRARFRSLLLATSVEGYAGCCEAIAGWDLRDELSRVRVPTLVLAGGEDAAIPRADAELLAERIPGARLVVLDGAAHLANVERPRAFAEAVLAHVAGAAPADAERRARGMAIRREVLGDEHVDRAIAGTTAFTADFQDLITRYAWGEIWSRPSLDRRTRSAITLTALTALGHYEELALHVRAALRNGLTRAEIEEVLLQAAVYCGVPAANRAFAVAQEALAER